jgi:signal transduction histidine kinase
MVIVLVKIFSMILNVLLSGFTDPTPVEFALNVTLLWLTLIAINRNFFEMRSFFFFWTVVWMVYSFSLEYLPEAATPMVPPVLSHFARMTMIPIASYHLMRGWHAFVITVLTIAMFCHSFYFSLGQTYTIPSDGLGVIFLSGLLTHVYPLWILKTFDTEMRLFHSLLDKFLTVSEDRSREKTTFISRMSHELRTPLHGLLSSAKLLRHTAISEEQNTFLTIIDSCGEVILDVIVKILDITKIESGDFQKSLTAFNLFDLTKSLAESLFPLAESKRLDLSIKFDLHPQGYDVRGDKVHLREILLNVSGLSFFLSFFPLLGPVVQKKKTPTNSPQHINTASWKCHQVHQPRRSGDQRYEARHSLGTLFELHLRD